MPARSDRILLELICRDDDQRALEQLFERHYEPLCYFILSFVKVPELSEEVASDLFVEIWRRRQTLRIRGSVKAYLFVSARNRALNAVERERRSGVREQLDEQEFSSEELQPDRVLQLRELEHAVDALMECLPPRRKRIFRLSRIEGFTYAEIAEILSISVYTVQNQMVRAVRQLALLSRRVRDDH